jgi:hypothetical protein
MEQVAQTHFATMFVIACLISIFSDCLDIFDHLRADFGADNRGDDDDAS